MEASGSELEEYPFLNATASPERVLVLPPLRFTLPFVLAFALGLLVTVLALAVSSSRTLHGRAHQVDVYALHGALAQLWLLFLGLLPHFAVFIAPSGWVWGEVGCSILPYLQLFPFAVLGCLHTLAAASAARNARPTTRTRVQWKHKALLCAAWASGFLLLPQVFLNGLIETGKRYICIQSEASDWMPLAHSVVTLLVVCVFPGLALLVAYPVAFCRAYRTRNKVTSKTEAMGFPIYRLESRRQGDFTFRHILAASMMDLMFLLCVCPYFCLKTALILEPSVSSHPFLKDYWTYLDILRFSCTFLVPLVYVLVPGLGKTDDETANKSRY